MSQFVETFEAPHLGMDTESAPHRLAKGYARDVVNLLTGTPGRVRPRGGMTSGGISPFVASDISLWANGAGSLLLSRAGNTALKLATTELHTFAGVTASAAAAVPGVPFAPVGNVVYGPSATGAFLRWDGVAASPTIYTNAPTSPVAITYWLNRLWTLGGKLAGSATVQSDRLGWSDLLDGSTALPDALSAWQDDVSGLTNQLVLPAVGQGGNAPVGFGRLTNAMVVFGARGGDLLIGSSPSNILARARAVSHGCVDRRTIVEYNGGVIWLAPEGLFVFDGSQEAELSGPIRADIQNLMRGELRSAHAVVLPNDVLLLTIDTDFAGSARLLLHLPTRSWSRITMPDQVGTTQQFLGIDGTYGGQRTRVVMWDGNYLWRLDAISQPTDFVVAGVDSTALDTGHLPFTAAVSSRLAALGLPSLSADITVLTTISSAVRGTTPPSEGEGWSVALIDGSETLIYPGQPLTSSQPGVGGLNILKRDVFEPHAEARDIYAYATFTGGTTMDFSQAELQDIYVEYDVAQKPASF